MKQPSSRDRTILANRLKLHLLEWGETGPVVLLLHGFLEHAHGWDFVAPSLAESGYHVFALDWRGHGDSAWVGAGGYYHFLDYVADLSCLRPHLGDSITVIAHSMGGGAAILYAGTEPQHVRALVTIEGLGVPDFDPQDVPERVVGWIREMNRTFERKRKAVSFEAAVSRLRERNPTFTEAMARHMVEHGTRSVGDGREWKFDPLHQTRSPQPTYVAQARAFWQRIRCPVLYIEGEHSLLRYDDADVDERLSTLKAERSVIEGAAHHPQLEQPQRLSEVLVDFLRRTT